MTIKYQKVWDTMNALEMVISKVVSAREMIDIANEALEYNQKERAEMMTMAAYEFLGYFIEDFDKKFKDAWQATVGDLREGDVKEDPCMPPWGHSDLEYVSKHKKPLSCDKDDPSPECKGAWNSFWEETPSVEEPKSVKLDGYSVDGIEHSKYWYDYDRNDPNRLNPFSGKVYESPDGGKTVYARNPGETERTLVKEDKVVKWRLPVELDPSGEYFVTFPDDLLEAANLSDGDTVEWVDKGDGSYMLRKVIKNLGPDEC